MSKPASPLPGPQGMESSSQALLACIVPCRKITDDEVAQLRARYAGSQADRNAAAAASSAAPAAANGKAAKGGAKAAAAAGGKAAAGGDAKAAAGGAGGAAADGKAAKKEKAASGKGGGKEPERPVDVGRLDLRVGLINKAWRHPDAER